MKETLTIRNFGPVFDLKIDLKPVTLLIGEQGTGKSTIAKLLNIFKSTDFITKKRKEDRLQVFKDNNLLSYFGVNTYINFKSNEYSVTYNHNQFRVNIGSELKSIIEHYEKNIDTNIISKELISERRNLIYKIEEKMGNASYIPTERVIIPLLSSSSFRIFQEKVNIPDYIINFGANYEVARQRIKDVKIEILNVDYHLEGNKDFIFEKGKKTLLTETASGYQTLIPLIVTVTDQTSASLIKGLFIIEEPELNLFPSTQFSLIKYLVNKCLIIKDRILLTTHSPYILTSLNNLMYAWQVGQKNEEEVSKIIDKKYWVNPAEVSAYQLMIDGTAKNIIADDGLIMAENIDSVSNTISYEYDSISAISYGE